MVNHHIRTAEQCAQEQLDAYNDRDIERFASVYAFDVQLIDLASGNTFCNSKEALIERYGPMFDSHPDLHCKLLNRLVCSPFVIDEEDVSGIHAGMSLHAIATYECHNGFIQRAWFVREEPS